MKKVIGIAVILLLACAVMASASATNWTLSIKASDSGGSHYNGANTIGTMVGYTDGLDSGAKGEPGTIGNPPPGATLATAAVKIDDNNPGIMDVRAPMTEGQTKTWSVHIYNIINDGPTYDPIKVVITPSTSTFAPVYMIGTTAYQFTFSGEAFTGLETALVYDGSVGHALPTSLSVTLSDPASTFADADILTITYSPVAIPEPGSLLALGCGLIGLVGFAVRRRK